MSVTSTTAAGSKANMTVPNSLYDEDIQLFKSRLPSEIKNHKLAEKLVVAMQKGRQAGQSILGLKNTGELEVETKTDNTLVTAADRASNFVICQTLHCFYPIDGILSKEEIKAGRNLSPAIAKGVDAEWTWVIDPLNETKSFIRNIYPNFPLIDPRYQGNYYGVHIGLLSEGEPVMGVNFYPEVNTLYFALDGFAYKQVGDAPAARIFNQPLLGIHPVLNTSPNERDIVGKIYQKLLGKPQSEAFNDKGLFLDSFGYKMACIAEGRGCNLFIAPAGGPGFWDVCSMQPLVQAVGGKVTDWEGNPINFRDRSLAGLLPKGVIIAMDPEVHKRTVEIIAELTANGEIPPYGLKN